MTDEPPADLQRSFGWEDMFASPEEDPREDPVTATDERGVLTAYLRNYRLTLQLKCQGLEPEQLAQRSVPPSNLSLLGLVRHLASVEAYWFRIRMAGQSDTPRLYRGEGDDEFEDAVGTDECVRAAWADWEREVAFAERVVEGFADLGAPSPDGELVLREVVVHLIEEYARHAGHADLLRERIDGRIGQ